MLPLVPLLLLAYAALYAFAAAIPVTSGATQLDLRDALGPAAPAPLIQAVRSNGKRRSRSGSETANSTPVVGDTSMAGRAVVVSLVTGEGQGFYHPCHGPRC